MELGTKLLRRAAWLRIDTGPVDHQSMASKIHRVWKISIWPLKPLSILLHAVLGLGDWHLWILSQLLTLWPKGSTNRRSERRNPSGIPPWWRLGYSGCFPLPRARIPIVKPSLLVIAVAMAFFLSGNNQYRNDDFTPTRLGCFTSLVGSIPARNFANNPSIKFPLMALLKCALFPAWTLIDTKSQNFSVGKYWTWVKSLLLDFFNSSVILRKFFLLYRSQFSHI